MSTPTVQRALWFGGLAVAAITVAGMLYWQWPEASKPLAVHTPAPLAPLDKPSAPQAIAPERKQMTATPAQQGPLVAGMADTEVDGELLLDANGNLQMQLGVRDYIDYFLSAADEAGIDAAVAAMMADAKQRLQEPALSQFVNVLGDYLAYKEASIALLSQPLTAAQQNNPQDQLGALKQGLQALDNLRREHFSPAAVEGFFGAEEAYSRYTLGVMALQQREDLSDADKQLREEALRAALPAAMQASQSKQMQALAVEEQARSLMASKTDEGQVRAFLSQHYEPKVVEAMLQEQRAEQAWDGQYQQYRQELARLRAAGMAEQDQVQAQQKLRQQWFSEEQWHKVETYDAFNDPTDEPDASSPAS
ncbi:lipase secretion chaperone [Atopomonas sediminilitoris]|uniref:lipase secretion chaperone n=1 Tax=Atopomonas sediminilitoris TaxID=2919919 RepID=UPI001F4E9119|nr:lipase secretion chaperone [Atopomonas sediminilitoris]MCJ8168917.1 lipase chaperone [Atopomonas sediminilitoris]